MYTQLYTLMKFLYSICQSLYSNINSLKIFFLHLDLLMNHLNNESGKDNKNNSSHQIEHTQIILQECSQLHLCEHNLQDKISLQQSLQQQSLDQCQQTYFQSKTEKQTHISNILSKIQLKSIEIIRPEHDSTLYRKLHISIILDELNDEARKMIRFLSSQFSMNLYESWQNFITKNKKIQPNFDQLLIINEKSQQKIIRQLKINPSLRVILYTNVSLSEYCKSLFQKKQFQNYMMVTDSPQQIKDFLIKNKKRLIVTAKR